MTVGVYTSISPTHALGDHQQVCAGSWISAGYTYTTVNATGEHVEVPQGAKRVDVQPSTGYKRPYIYIDDIIRQAITDGVDYAIITNSDIELRSDNAHHLGMKGLTIGRRINYDGDWSKGRAEEWGIDVFIMDRATLLKVPKNLFVMGQTWWDYWLPYWAIHANIPMRIVPPLCYGHRWHKQQWSNVEWQRQTLLFQGTTGAFVGMKPYDCGMKIWRLINDKGK